MTDRLTLPQPAAALVLAKRITAYGFDTAPTVRCTACWRTNRYDCLVCKGHGMVPLAVGPVELWSSTEAPKNLGQMFGPWRIARVPSDGSAGLWYSQGRSSLASVGSEWVLTHQGLDNDERIPLPLGARLGTVNITAIIPIVDLMTAEGFPDEGGSPIVYIYPDDKLIVSHHFEVPVRDIDISGQRQYSTFTPGGFCAIFEDDGPPTVTCGICGGSGITDGCACGGLLGPVSHVVDCGTRLTCSECHGSGTRLADAWQHAPKAGPE